MQNYFLYHLEFICFGFWILVIWICNFEFLIYLQFIILIFNFGFLTFLAPRVGFGHSSLIKIFAFGSILIRAVDPPLSLFFEKLSPVFESYLCNIIICLTNKVFQLNNVCLCSQGRIRSPVSN